MAKARKTPHITVSAVVPPALDEELSRLAASQRISKSQLIRQLLEQMVTQHVNERSEDAFSRVEKRLQRIEERFSAFITKAVRASGQGLFVSMKQLEYMEDDGKEINKIWEGSKEFAGKLLEQKQHGGKRDRKEKESK